MVRYHEFNEAKPVPAYTPEQEAIVQNLKEYFNFKTLKFNKDESIDIIGSCICLLKKSIDKLPVIFRRVEKHFSISNMNLKTLEGSPRTVGGVYNCAYNELISLAGAPDIVGHLNIGFNKLTSLEGIPRISENGTMSAYENQLTSLAGCPQTLQHLDVSYNNLTSLVGCTKFIKQKFDASKNPLTSLEGLPQSIGEYIIITYSPNLPLLRLLGLRCGIHIYATDENKMNGVIYKDLEKIMIKYMGDLSRSNILKCQRELIDAGYEGNARW